MTVEIESVLGAEDVRQVIESAEQAGSMRASELAELVEAHELAELEAEALRRELEQRGIDIVEEKGVWAWATDVAAVTVEAHEPALMEHREGAPDLAARRLGARRFDLRAE